MPPIGPEHFMRLFAAHEHELYRYVRTMVHRAADADDIMQETAAALWRKFEQYDGDRPFLPWAAQFAYHEVLSYRKKQAVHQRHFSDAVIESLAAERMESQPMLEAQRRALGDCLAKLTDTQRDLLSCRYGREQTIQSLAAERGQPVATLYKTLHRVRKRLLDCVTATLESEGHIV